MRNGLWAKLYTRDKKEKKSHNQNLVHQKVCNKGDFEYSIKTLL